MENEKFVSDSAVFDHEKTRWGAFHSIAEFEREGHKAKVKVLVLEEGKNISYQKHHERAEVWNVLSGKGTVVIEGLMFEIQQGDVVNIPLGCWHTVKADDNSHLEILEVQFGTKVEESDITRSHYEWKDIIELVEEL